MLNITANEIKIVLFLFKNYNCEYNARTLSKKVGLSHVGTFKILKRLEKQIILTAKHFGRAIMYKVNFKNDYTKKYLKFLLEKESEQAIPRVKRWIIELEKFKNISEIGVLFGSVLKKEDYEDVDLLLVLKPQDNEKVNNLINSLNKINIKKLHVIKQTPADLTKNLKKNDKVIVSTTKNGIVLFGHDKLINIIENVTQ